MPSPAEKLAERAVELVSEGQTEEAILFLEQELKAIPNRDPKVFQDVVLLSNMYNNYERKKLRGTIDDAKEMNKITSEVLELVERIRNRGIYAARDTAAQPLMNVSPDPLQPVLNTPPPVHPQGQDTGGVSKSTVIAVLGTLVVIFVLLLIYGAYLDQEPVEEPVTNVEEIIAPTPGKETSDNTVDTGLSTSEIRSQMAQLFVNGNELTEDDYTPSINREEVRQQFGGTTWFHDDFGYLTFDESGMTATYTNGGGKLEIVNGTIHGFYESEFTQSSDDDSGYIDLIPPGQEAQLTIYIESNKSERVGFMELQRR